MLVFQTILLYNFYGQVQFETRIVELFGQLVDSELLLPLHPHGVAHKRVMFVLKKFYDLLLLVESLTLPPELILGLLQFEIVRIGLGSSRAAFLRGGIPPAFLVINNAADNLLYFLALQVVGITLEQSEGLVS